MGMKLQPAYDNSAEAQIGQITLFLTFHLPQSVSSYDSENWQIDLLVRS